jgi:hypothetical protein
VSRDRRAWRAGTAVQAAFIRVDFAEHHLRAIAAWRHLAGACADTILTNSKLQPGIMRREARLEPVTLDPDKKLTGFA